MELGKSVESSAELFNAYMDSVVHEVNARVLGKGLELLV